MSLRWRILLFSAGSVLAILVIMSALGISASRESVNLTLDERLVLAEQVAHNADFGIEQSFQQLQTVGSTNLAQIQAGRPVPESFLKDLKPFLPFDTNYLYLLDPKGKVVMTDPLMEEFIGTNLSQEAYLGSVLGSRAALMSNAVFDTSIKRYVTYMTVPLANSVSGEAPMILVAAVDLSSSSVQNLINVGGVGKTGYIEIVDGKGMVLATTNPGDLLKQSDHYGTFAKLIQDHKTAVSTCHNCHDVPENEQRSREIITFAPLAATTWGVVVRQSEDEALANARLLQQRLILFGFLAFVIILPTVWFATKRIIDPVNRLTLASRKISQGSLDETVAISGKDEISVLSQSFDTMRTKLKDSIERLQQRTKELEGLNAIALTVCQSLNLDSMLDGALARIIDLVRMEVGLILLAEEDSGRLSYRVCRGLSAGRVESLEPLRLDESLERRVLINGEPMVISDLSTEHPSQHPVSIGKDMRAFACFPLRSKDKTIGLMILASKAAHDFAPGDRQLLFSIASQISIAMENAKLFEDVRQKEVVLAELLKNSISAQEDERKRIARELHDETSQSLTTLAIGLETIAKSPPADEEHLRLALRKNQELIIRIMDDVHRLILDLRPNMIDDLGLVPALEWYADSRLGGDGVEVHVETSGCEKRMPGHIEVALFRIAQEAISNIAQHARAESASISLDFESRHVRLTVEDDGIGFESEGLVGRIDGRRGLGLLGMMERAKALGGILIVNSKPGTGTRISIEIPVNWNWTSS
jgi:signal transduction histidine kinase